MRLPASAVKPPRNDRYACHRANCTFILVDEPSNLTVAAGMLLAPDAEQGNGTAG